MDDTDLHYLRMIRKRLVQLYDEHPNDATLREQISDECSWIDEHVDADD